MFPYLPPTRGTPNHLTQEGIGNILNNFCVVRYLSSPAFPRKRALDLWVHGPPQATSLEKVECFLNTVGRGRPGVCVWVGGWTAPAETLSSDAWRASPRGGGGCVCVLCVHREGIFFWEKPSGPAGPWLTDTSAGYCPIGKGSPTAAALNSCSTIVSYRLNKYTTPMKVTIHERFCFLALKNPCLHPPTHMDKERKSVKGHRP